MAAAQVTPTSAGRVSTNSIGAAGALGGLALMWILPFLWSQHWYPMASLYSELVSASCLALAILSCGLMKKAEAQLDWPFPVVMLALIAIVLVQQMIGMLAYSKLAVRFVLL